MPALRLTHVTTVGRRYSYDGPCDATVTWGTEASSVQVSPGLLADLLRVEGSVGVLGTDPAGRRWRFATKDTRSVWKVPQLVG